MVREGQIIPDLCEQLGCRSEEDGAVHAWILRNAFEFGLSGVGASKRTGARWAELYRISRESETRRNGIDPPYADERIRARSRARLPKAFSSRIEKVDSTGRLSRCD